VIIASGADPSNAVEPAHRRLVVDGLAFGVLSSLGAGAGSAYVLVHGIGTSHRYLARLHRRLARTNTVHSVDLPGFGGLPKPKSDTSVPVVAAALASVLERLGVSGAVLVGHSMGAQWVTELAVQRPDLVSHVILIGPVVDDRHRTALAQSTALGLDTLGEPVEGNLTVFADYLRCGPRWYLTQLREMLRYPLEDKVSLLRMPMLIIRGGNDPIAGPSWTRRLRDRAVFASSVTIPGHRHLVQHTAPAAVAAAMAHFVSEPGSDSLGDGLDRLSGLRGAQR
jgi:pimeloyl-ACP methyl ester carboxylesterase